MIKNNLAMPTDQYTRQPYAPPDPKYFDYENRYRTSRKFQSYEASQEPTPATATPGIEEFLMQKQDLNRYRIQMLYTEMGVRSYINGQILYRINYDQCTCQNLIMARGDEFLDRQRMELENKILDFEQEKRREEAAFFRDLSFLNKELRFARIEALDEHHKQALCLNMEAKL